MKPESVNEIFSLIEARAAKQPTSMEFEFAYQVRVAIDHVRFAIRGTERPTPHSETRQISRRPCSASLRNLSGASVQVMV
jgi:hypothetical protein